MGHVLDRCDLLDVLEQSARLNRPLIVELEGGERFVDETREVLSEEDDDWAVFRAHDRIPVSDIAFCRPAAARAELCRTIGEVDLRRRVSPTTRGSRRASLLALLTLMLGAILAGISSCRRAASAFDCQAVCARYRDCIDIKYDVSVCRQRCRDRAISETKFEKKADACESCIRGHSCMGATFECGGECLGVVP